MASAGWIYKRKTRYSRKKAAALSWVEYTSQCHLSCLPLARDRLPLQWSVPWRALVHSGLPCDTLPPGQWGWEGILVVSLHRLYRSDPWPPAGRNLPPAFPWPVPPALFYQEWPVTPPTAVGWTRELHGLSLTNRVHSLGSKLILVESWRSKRLLLREDGMTPTGWHLTRFHPV